MKKILSVLSICFLVLASLCLTACGEKQNATSVMTMSVNPSVQFVLDQNNKVMNVTSTNADGEKLIANVNFKGKTADEASKLFVQITTELSASGNLNTNIVGGNGTEVTISISAEEETAKIKELKEKVQNSVNQYFKDNGIIAGAKVVSQDIVDAINNYGKQVEDVSKKTYAEAISYANQIAGDLDEISYNLQNTAMEAINSIKQAYQTTIDTLDGLIEKTETALKNSELLSKEAKADLQKKLNEYKKQYNDTKAKIEKEIDNKIAEFKQQSKDALNKLKTEVNDAVNKGKKVLETHKAEFEKNKEAIIKQIEDFQKSLVSVQ